MSQKHYRP